MHGFRNAEALFFEESMTLSHPLDVSLALMDHHAVDVHVMHTATPQGPDLKPTAPATTRQLESLQTMNALMTAASSTMSVRDSPIASNIHQSRRSMPLTQIQSHIDPNISAAASACPLLDLPAELRIQIWEFVLGEKRDIITISPFNKQLGLIGTCNQIRAEVLDIWLPNTSVVVKVYQCNFETHLAWARLMRHYNPNGSVRVHLVGAKHGVKLVKWLKACHEAGFYHYARMTLGSMDRRVQESQNEIAELTASGLSANALMRKMDMLGLIILHEG